MRINSEFETLCWCLIFFRILASGFNENYDQALQQIYFDLKKF